MTSNYDFEYENTIENYYKRHTFAATRGHKHTVYRIWVNHYILDTRWCYVY